MAVAQSRAPALLTLVSSLRFRLSADGSSRSDWLSAGLLDRAGLGDQQASRVGGRAEVLRWGSWQLGLVPEPAQEPEGALAPGLVPE